MMKNIRMLKSKIKLIFLGYGMLLRSIITIFKQKILIEIQKKQIKRLKKELKKGGK